MGTWSPGEDAKGSVGNNATTKCPSADDQVNMVYPYNEIFGQIATHAAT